MSILHLGRRNDSADLAGTVSEIASVSGAQSGRVITAVRTGRGTLRLISWQVRGSSPISRLGDSGNQAGEASNIDIARGNRVVTALRNGSGNLLLISWDVTAAGTITRRGDTDEPDYPALATLGPEAVPHLKALVRSDDPGIAAKAAYLASLIESDESMEVIEAASASPHETVRVAAAAGMRNLTSVQAGPTIERLLDDKDAGVRKLALQAVAALGISTLDPKVKKMAAGDPEKGIRQLAKQGLQRNSEVQDAGPTAARLVETKPAKRAAHRRSKRREK
jgi:hypothetical protein